MKRLSLAIFILLMTISCYSQRLDVDDLIKIQGSSVDQMNDVLTGYSWELTQIQKKGDIDDFDGKTWPSMEAKWKYNSYFEKESAWLTAEFYTDFTVSKDVADGGWTLEVVMLTYSTPDVSV